MIAKPMIIAIMTGAFDLDETERASLRRSFLEVYFKEVSGSTLDVYLEKVSASFICAYLEEISCSSLSVDMEWSSE